MKKFLEPGLFEILKLLIGVQKKNRKEPAPRKLSGHRSTQCSEVLIGSGHVFGNHDDEIGQINRFFCKCIDVFLLHS